LHFIKNPSATKNVYANDLYCHFWNIIKTVLAPFGYKFEAMRTKPRTRITSRAPSSHSDNAQCFEWLFQQRPNKTKRITDVERLLIKPELTLKDLCKSVEDKIKSTKKSHPKTIMHTNQPPLMWVRDFISIDKKNIGKRKNVYFVLNVNDKPKKHKLEGVATCLTAEQVSQIQTFVDMIILEFLQHPDMAFDLNENQFYRVAYELIVQDILIPFGYSAESYPVEPTLETVRRFYMSKLFF
jgi:hypothetical protein